MCNFHEGLQKLESRADTKCASRGIPKQVEGTERNARFIYICIRVYGYILFLDTNMVSHTAILKASSLP